MCYTVQVPVLISEVLLTRAHYLLASLPRESVISKLSIEILWCCSTCSAYREYIQTILLSFRKTSSDMRSGLICLSGASSLMLLGMFSIDTAYCDIIWQISVYRLGLVQRQKESDARRLWSARRFSSWCLFFPLFTWYGSSLRNGKGGMYGRKSNNVTTNGRIGGRLWKAS